MVKSNPIGKRLFAFDLSQFGIKLRCLRPDFLQAIVPKQNPAGSNELSQQLELTNPPEQKKNNHRAAGYDSDDRDPRLISFSFSNFSIGLEF